MYDVIIIGGGISGCAVAYELSKYKVNILMLEKENDISLGTTKANSAIIHSGYDPLPNTKMAKYNVEGNKLVNELCKKLDVAYKQIGSLVIAFDENEMKTLYILYEQGIKNKVPNIKILNKQQTLQIEPNINENICGALYSPSTGIINPWELAIALAETAVKNGMLLKLNQNVINITKQKNMYTVVTNDNSYTAKYVINASGISADIINEMINKKSFTIKPSKGEYYILDKSQGTLVSHVIFQCPTEIGKGVLVSPTVDGNLIVGPNSNYTEANDFSTSSIGLEFVKNTSLKSVPNINYKESIRNFAGLRATTQINDFIIDETSKGFFNIGGIKSPGLSSAPAIAIDIVNMLNKSGLNLEKKENYIDSRKIVRFKYLNHAERKKIIELNHLYGKIICRCETVTEGEIVEALHRVIVPISIDAVKRRCNAGMGRCQGGFCLPRVQEIISRELNIKFEDITLDKAKTNIVIGKTKTGGNKNAL